MIRVILIFFTLLIFFSCKDSIPSGVIAKEKMQQVLWDVLRADALSQQIIKKDSTKSQTVESAILTKKVFLIHHISEEEFKKSYAYYTSRPDLMKPMIDSINAQQVRMPAIVIPGPKKIKLSE